MMIYVEKLDPFFIQYHLEVRMKMAIRWHEYEFRCRTRLQQADVLHKTGFALNSATNGKQVSRNLGMAPVASVTRIARRQPQDVTLDVYAKSQYRAIGIGEIGRHLIDLQYFAIIKARYSQPLNVIN